jgi:tRNA pseudouridine32 synthase/23S rRNA pseudouridine746 synthase
MRPGPFAAAVLHAPLLRCGPRGASVRVDPDGEDAVSILWPQPTAAEDSTLVCVWPQTGRQHQVRAHLAAVGLPIVGDARYGSTVDPPLLLHAWSLDLNLAEAGPGPVVAPLPAAFPRFG